MSNLDVGFFNDTNVSYSAKLGAAVLLLGAIPQYNKRGVNKNITVFEANLGHKLGLSPVFFDVGNSDSIGKLNSLAKAKEYSNPTFDLVGIVEGKFDDEKVAEMCAAEFKTRHAISFNNESLKDNIKKFAPRLSTYVNTWFEQDPTSFNPVVKENAEKFIEEAIDVYNNGGVGRTTRAQGAASIDGKKKQPMTEAPAQI